MVWLMARVDGWSNVVAELPKMCFLTYGISAPVATQT